jgi:hypothetical protein
MTQPDPAVFSLESSEKVAVSAGKRPAVAAQAARLVTQKGPDGINRNVQQMAVEARPEGPLRIMLTVQGLGQVTAELTPREAWQLAEKLFEYSGWLDVELAVPEAKTQTQPDYS